MLPLYKAIHVKEVLSENVGHTKPWVVLANTPQGLKSFVVKMYTVDQVERLNSVSVEVICNILAREFDLVTPSCAFIDIPPELSLFMKPEEQQQFDNTDPRLKFCTELVDNVNTATNDLKKEEFQKRISMGLLYGFDNLIRNTDRGIKPNLLLKPEEAILIDHERALRYEYINNINLDTLQLEDTFTKYHLFYRFLKRKRKENKIHIFDEFSEYLTGLRINKLNPYFQQLRGEGFNDYSTSVIAWLSKVQQNCTTFVNKLKASIQ